MGGMLAAASGMRRAGVETWVPRDSRMLTEQQAAYRPRQMNGRTAYTDCDSVLERGSGDGAARREAAIDRKSSNSSQGT